MASAGCADHSGSLHSTQPLRREPLVQCGRFQAGDVGGIVTIPEGLVGHRPAVGGAISGPGPAGDIEHGGTFSYQVFDDTTGTCWITGLPPTAGLPRKAFLWQLRGNYGSRNGRYLLDARIPGGHPSS